ncbi:hypothetical protein COO91_00346 [Nostoc flagelliforme CCNUN1]|uniref:Uncharacterized protein n=1 Tax=Nostoc flagelliforme CCNUN1 TaxID=2038116 RepID=A0A2K8SGY9_9NOSO|nr:hypothetical protein COO91_00346 [Nostoc flagelliforme CCNUN1]
MNIILAINLFCGLALAISYSPFLILRFVSRNSGLLAQS